MKLKDNQFKDHLTALRAERGLTQEELARALNVTRQTVSKWERGLVAPDTVNLSALGRLYGVSLDELVNGPPQEEPAPAEEAPPDAPPESAPAEEAPPDAPPESAPAGEGEASPLLQPPPIRVRRLGGKATAVFGTLCLIAAIIIFYFSVFTGSERKTPAPMDELGQDRIVITGNLKWEPIK